MGSHARGRGVSDGKWGLSRRESLGSLWVEDRYLTKVLRLRARHVAHPSVLTEGLGGRVRLGRQSGVTTSSPCGLQDGELASCVSVLPVTRLSKIRCNLVNWPTWVGRVDGQATADKDTRAVSRPRNARASAPLTCANLGVVSLSLFCEQTKESAQRKVVCQELTSLQGPSWEFSQGLPTPSPLGALGRAHDWLQIV